MHSVVFPRFFSDKQSDRQTDRKTNIVVYRKVTLHKKNCKYLINIKIKICSCCLLYTSKKMSVSTNAQTGFTEGLSSGYCTSRYVLVDLKRMLIVGQMTQGRHNKLFWRTSFHLKSESYFVQFWWNEKHLSVLPKNKSIKLSSHIWLFKICTNVNIISIPTIIWNYF